MRISDWSSDVCSSDLCLSDSIRLLRLWRASGRRCAAALSVPAGREQGGRHSPLAPPGRAATRVSRLLLFVPVLRLQPDRCRGSVGSFLTPPPPPSGPGFGGWQEKGNAFPKDTTGKPSIEGPEPRN